MYTKNDVLRLVYINLITDAGDMAITLQQPYPTRPICEKDGLGASQRQKLLTAGTKK